MDMCRLTMMTVISEDLLTCMKLIKFRQLIVWCVHMHASTTVVSYVVDKGK